MSCRSCNGGDRGILRRGGGSAMRHVSGKHVQLYRLMCLKHVRGDVSVACGWGTHVQCMCGAMHARPCSTQQRFGSRQEAPPARSRHYMCFDLRADGTCTPGGPTRCFWPRAVLPRFGVNSWHPSLAIFVHLESAFVSNTAGKQSFRLLRGRFSTPNKTHKLRNFGAEEARE